MNRTKIEWVVDRDGRQGFTWNPVTGCRHGCEYCYAEKIALHYRSRKPLGDDCTQPARKLHEIRYKTTDFWRYGFEPTLHSYRLDLPMGKKKPSTFFVCSMADLFGKWVPDAWIEAVLKTAWQCTQHKFLFLTKNPKRYRSLKFPGNCWPGTTVTTMNDAWRINRVRELDNNFLSCEPLLGDISSADLTGIKWIIIGSLNLNGRAVSADQGGTKIEWVRNLLIEAYIQDIPVFVKDGLCEELPAGLQLWRELPYLKGRKVEVK